MNSHDLLNTSVSYPDDGGSPYVFSAFSHLAARSLVAAYDTNNTPQTLTIGASGNIVMESMHDINVVVKNTSKFNFYHHDTVTGDHVLFMNIYKSNDNKVFFHTNDNPLVLDSPIVYMNDLQVSGYFNIGGGILGNSLNVVKYKSPDTVNDPYCTGYGLTININDELELIKYSVYENDKSVFKRVAVFGTGNKFSYNDANESNNPLLPFNVTNNMTSNLSNIIGNNTICNTTCTSSNQPWTYNVDTNTIVSVPLNALVGIGTSTPQHELHVIGTILTDNVVTKTISFLSDERLKTDVRLIGTGGLDDCLNRILSLNVVRFKFKDEVDDNIGLIAQQANMVSTDFVNIQKAFGFDDCMAINTNNVLMYLVGAVQSLHNKFYT